MKEKEELINRADIDEETEKRISDLWKSLVFFESAKRGALKETQNEQNRRKNNPHS